MKKLLLSLLILPGVSLNAMQVIPSSCKDNIRLLHDGKRTFVEDENAAYRVENYQMNPLIRKLIERNALTKFANKDGYVRVTKDNENIYKLAAKVRGNGGGWLTGQIAGWTVRIGGYSAFGIACFFHPAYIAEAHIVHEAVEATAMTVQIAGEVLPTP